MQTIDKQKALELLRAAVRVGGRHKVQSAKYFNADGTPCCVVGTALAIGGVTAEQMRNVNESRLSGHWVKQVTPFLTDGARKVLQKAQDVQDGNTLDGLNKEWGTAVEEAERVARWTYDV